MSTTAIHTESGLITSIVATPDLTRPHLFYVCDFYTAGDQGGGTCVQCGAYGELSALRDLSPSSYGCQPGIEPFSSPAPLWR